MDPLYLEPFMQIKIILKGKNKLLYGIYYFVLEARCNEMNGYCVYWDYFLRSGSCHLYRYDELYNETYFAASEESVKSKLGSRPYNRINE